MKREAFIILPTLEVCWHTAAYLNETLLHESQNLTENQHICWQETSLLNTCKLKGNAKHKSKQQVRRCQIMVLSNFHQRCLMSMLAISDLPRQLTSPQLRAPSLIGAFVGGPKLIKLVMLFLSSYCLKTPKSGLAAVALMKASALPFKDKMR